MRNAIVDKPALLPAHGGVVRNAGIAGIVVAVVVVAIVASLLAVRAQTGTESPSLTQAQQAEADRLAGLAEYYGIASVLRSRAADAARWEARAAYYQVQRARQAEADRLTGLAERYGATLTRAQKAEADRLTGLTERYGAVSWVSTS